MASEVGEAWNARRCVCERSGLERARHNGEVVWFCEGRRRDWVVKWRQSGLRSWYRWVLVERLARMRSGCAAAARGSRAGDTKLIVVGVPDVIQTIIL